MGWDIQSDHTRRFQQTPADWPLIKIKPITPEEIVRGYMLFDPHLLVACGKVADDASKLANAGASLACKRYHTVDNYEAGFRGYGVGLMKF